MRSALPTIQHLTKETYNAEPLKKPASNNPIPSRNINTVSSFNQQEDYTTKTFNEISARMSGFQMMASSKIFTNCGIFLVLILMYGYGYMSYYQKNGNLVAGFRSLYKNLNVMETQRPVNNLTYPAFRHPLAPPYPYPYKFIFNQADKCKGRNPFLVIMVIGEVQDIASRHVIRETWGNVSLYDLDVVLIFLMGLSKVASKEVQMMLEEENTIYGDIVQQDFMDTYYNLTLKTLMGMEWVMKFCSTASYVMKIDNDMFLNVDYLSHRFLRPDLPLRTNYFTGLIVARTQPLRNNAYKWYVPKEVYPNDTYPPYCSGPGYLFSSDMAKKIYTISQVIRVIPMEDAFTGICLYELKIPLTKPPTGLFNGHRIEYDRCRFHKLITVHHYKKAELQKIWNDFWGMKNKGCDS
ncbi:beta-1,3-galactosyltransferase 1-like [Gastrophryne carolinensis]